MARTEPERQGLVDAVADADREIDARPDRGEQIQSGEELVVVGRESEAAGLRARHEISVANPGLGPTYSSRSDARFPPVLPPNSCP